MDICWNTRAITQAEHDSLGLWYYITDGIVKKFHFSAGRPASAQPGSLPETLPSSPQSTPLSTASPLQGKRVGMVTFSPYPFDPRPRRACSALLSEGMTVELICLGEENAPRREILNGINVYRVPVSKQRGGKLIYFYQYSAFIIISSLIFAWRALRRRYDLIYVNNMPDVLVFCALFPKMLGAKVILDQHDPMPELMTTIFNLGESSMSVRVIKWLEKWSIARADLVLTVNIACKRIFSSRSCRAEKIGVVMNAPDGKIFKFRAPAPPIPSADVSTKPFVIMYHGSLVERNGLDLAVDALALIKEVVTSAELRVYGHKNPFLDRVLALAREKGVEDRVKFLGPRRLEDLVGEIASCDVGVIPNHRSAFADINTPTRIFEYLAQGKPVIAPRTLGILDYFDTESLFFFESGDAKELAEKIIFVSAHPKEAFETAERGQKVFLAHTWDEERRTLVNLVGGLYANEWRGC